MKFDKETLIVVLVCAAVLIGWSVFYPKWQAQKAESVKQEQLAAQQAAAEAAKISARTVPPASPSPASPVNAVPAVPADGAAVATAATVPRRYSISSKYTDYYFNSAGVLDEIVLKKHFRTADKGAEKTPIVVQESIGYEPFAVAIPGVAPASVAVRKISERELSVTRTFAGALPFVLNQLFSVAEDGNVLKCRMELSTTAASGLKLPQMIVWAGTLAPLKQLANDALRDIHMVEFCRAGNGKVTTVDPTSKEEKFKKGATSDPLEWVALSNKYFLSLLVAEPVFNAGCRMVNPDRHDAQSGKSYKLPGVAGVYSDITVFSGKPFVSNYQFYLGPKDLQAMSGLPESTGNAVHLAYWGWLEPLCRPMLYLLNLLKDLTGSYGLAIILLTVIVKLVLWPLIHKGNKSMRRMQRVQPLVKELKEKYKDNQPEFSRQMMELYRRENVSPFGGCFPMLLQLPVFIALYSTLDSSVELRHVPFLWAQDLSRPDLVGPTIMGIGLHPFILISTGLMVLQQKLSPPMADPMQHKMMMLMPVIMLVFFYSFPSGLALYWTVNNILSILQMKYSQYAAKKEELALNGKAAG